MSGRSGYLPGMKSGTAAAHASSKVTSPGATPMTPTSPVTLSREERTALVDMVRVFDAPFATSPEQRRRIRERAERAIATLDASRAVTETPEGLDAKENHMEPDTTTNPDTDDLEAAWGDHRERWRWRLVEGDAGVAGGCRALAGSSHAELAHKEEHGG